MRVVPTMPAGPSGRVRGWSEGSDPTVDVPDCGLSEGLRHLPSRCTHQTLMAPLDEMRPRHFLRPPTSRCRTRSSQAAPRQSRATPAGGRRCRPGRRLGPHPRTGSRDGTPRRPDGPGTGSRPRGCSPRSRSGPVWPRRCHYPPLRRAGSCPPGSCQRGRPRAVRRDLQHAGRHGHGGWRRWLSVVRL